MADILAGRQPPVSLFVEDLSGQIWSVAQAAPQVWQLHMVPEPLIAPHRAPAPDAHARIDDWATAADWILARFAEESAPVLTGTARGD